ncbi:NADPH:quinone reductase [Oceanibacterium hippocampi]|uniref:L-threonine 3-dehydrogenase n=1 Tax=Oceanibacterium hippocampi TaxID=745714 RepID=A0A1Y5SQ18_9PROT|nr:NADPH:quinone reductase [Oceanibacterium hippocampi]SLN45634.1 L-threonine 3-dehydrogenase [Oceanibacterium hippocampi]
MRAAWYEKPGKAEEVLIVGELPDPEPGPGEVRVRIRHSAVNPTDVKRRQTGRDLKGHDRIVPNNDGAGVVDAVGPGVSSARIGEQVWIFGAQAGRAGGTAAEWTVLPSRQAIALPAGAGLELGASLGVPAVTAHATLAAGGGVRAGEKVLVTGAAGRVGRMAVRMALRQGAEVAATVRRDGDRAELAPLPPGRVFLADDPDLAAKVRNALGGRVERLVDVAFGSNLPVAASLIAANGVIATYASDAAPEPSLPFHSLMYLGVSIHMIAIYALPKAAQDRAFAAVTEALIAGDLDCRVGARFSLDQIAAAHRAIEEGRIRGSVLVDFSAQ